MHGLVESAQGNCGACVRTLRYDEVKYFILNRNRYEDADSRITDKYSSRHETPDQKTQPEFSTQDQMH